MARSCLFASQKLGIPTRRRERPLNVNDPEVVAEVEAEFARYEAALLANDVEALVAFFRDAPETVRYGIDDIQHGHAELAEFRRSQAQATPPRTLLRTVVTTFDSDFAVANTEFAPDAADVIGRQSQTWVRTAQGWRIVSAHVSWLGGRAP
jgi:ketosteroid isomerase-like protein